MNPSKVGDRLSEYLEGDLSQRERSRIDAALAEDRELREELRELEATLALLRGLPEPEVPPAFATRVIAHVRESEAEPRGLLAGLSGLFEPAVAVPLAAGITAVALFVGVQGEVAPTIDSVPAHLELAEVVAPMAQPEPTAAQAPWQPTGFAAAHASEPEMSLTEIQRRTLQTILSRSQHQDLGRLLRGSVHPHAASLASHFEGDGSLQIVSLQGRRRR